jgi:hypothetical protein
MKPKNILLFLVLLGAGLAVWFFVKPSSTKAPANEDTQQSQEQGNKDGDTVVEEIPNALEGELKASNDKRRGNLMLLLKDSDRVIYLNTSRDFSQLIGKQVSVSIEGSLDDFRLLDIKAQ